MNQDPPEPVERHASFGSLFQLDIMIKYATVASMSMGATVRQVGNLVS